MIDARELRLGNYFMAGKNSAVILEIMASGVSFDSINGDICASHCDWDYVSFIPLTEQWLIDFGLLKNDIGIWNNGDAIYFDYGKEKSTKIHNVHQLQNLYFALTGKELIKK